MTAWTIMRLDTDDFLLVELEYYRIGCSIKIFEFESIAYRKRVSKKKVIKSLSIY